MVVFMWAQPCKNLRGKPMSTRCVEGLIINFLLGSHEAQKLVADNNNSWVMWISGVIRLLSEYLFPMRLRQLNLKSYWSRIVIGWGWVGYFLFFCLTRCCVLHLIGVFLWFIILLRWPVNYPRVRIRLKTIWVWSIRLTWLHGGGMPVLFIVTGIYFSHHLFSAVAPLNQASLADSSRSNLVAAFTL